MELKKYLEKGMSYTQYRETLDKLIQENKTTGEDQSEQRINHAKLSYHRMQRVERSIEIEGALKKKITRIARPLTALVITEGWCGDSAQNTPVFGELEKLNKNFKTKVLLRDENPELMDKYLTDGGRAIPKVIFVDDESGKEVATWGPRPLAGQKVMRELKEKNASKEEKNLAVHLWYSKDKTQTLQKELSNILKSIS